LIDTCHFCFKLYVPPIFLKFSLHFPIHLFNLTELFIILS
jgi:hypothetical protein